MHVLCYSCCYWLVILLLSVQVKKHCNGMMLDVGDDADVDCDLDVMNVVNPNLAMTNCLLETEHDNYDSAEVYCDELNQTADVTPEIYMWDDSDVHESEPVVSLDSDQSEQLSVVSDQPQDMSAVSTSSTAALVVTCATKMVRQQPTIIVTHARHPASCSTSPVVARVSKAGILSRINPATVTINGTSGLVLKRNAVVVSSPENCLC